MSQKSIKKKDISFTLVGKGLLVSYLTTIPLFIIFSLILSTTELAERLITPAVVVTTIVSIMFAGFITARRLKSGALA